MPAYDAILIPGGGVRPGGKLPEWVQNRFDLAVELYSGELLIPLSAGTPHRPPPLDEFGYPILEAAAGAAYLVRLGIPVEKILIEASSYDTIGNAYFSRVLHVDPRGLRRLLVITSDFHVARTEKIFRWVYSLDRPVGYYTLDFRSVPDIGLPEEVLSARMKKEQASLARVREQSRQFDTLEKLHAWLFAEHEAYTAGKKPTVDSAHMAESY